MKRIAYIITTLALAVLATGCDSIFHGKEKEKRMVLFYIAATESSLSSYAETNITEMTSGYIPPENSKTQELLVFSHIKNSDATLRKYFTNRSGQVEYEVIRTFQSSFDACTPEGFQEVLETAEEECKPAYRSLLFSSHGTGWLPEGYFSADSDDEISINMATKSTESESISQLSKLRINESIGYDGYSKAEIDIRQFAEIAGKWHWETMIFDCCYMGAIEVAYQIRNICDYMIASPTEILVEGFPYRIILNELFNNPGRSGAEYIATQYYEKYQAYQGYYKSGCIVCADLSAIEPFAQVCADIVAEAGSRIQEVRRELVQKYFYRAISDKDYFFDLAHYFEQFCTEEQYAQFSKALDDLTVYKNSTGQFLTLLIEHYSGFSTYIPKAVYKNLNTYYKGLDWNQKIKLLE